MTKERAAKIILDLINAGEAEYINFSIEEIMAFKKAYVALNSEPTTNADRIRSLSDEELAKFFHDMIQDCGCNNVPCQQFCTVSNCELAWLNWLKKEARTND